MFKILLINTFTSISPFIRPFSLIWIRLSFLFRRVGFVIQHALVQGFAIPLICTNLLNIMMITAWLLVYCFARRESLQLRVALETGI